MEEIDVFLLPCPQGLVIRAMYNVSGTSEEWAEYIAFYTSTQAYETVRPRIVIVFKTDAPDLIELVEDKDGDGTIDARYTKDNIGQTYLSVCTIFEKQDK